MKEVVFYFFIMGILFIGAAALADDMESSCQDPLVDEFWENALTRYPDDNMMRNLSDVRSNLCRMLANKLIDQETATAQWEKALNDSLAETPHPTQTAQSLLLKLFGTF